MQFTAALALFLGAVAVSAAPSLNPNVAINATSVEALAPSANSWRMETWSGTSCTGEHFIWSAPDGHSCTNLAAVSSLKVTNLGGCRSKWTDTNIIAREKSFDDRY